MAGDHVAGDEASGDEATGDEVASDGAAGDGSAGDEAAPGQVEGRGCSPGGRCPGELWKQALSWPLQTWTTKKKKVQKNDLLILLKF